MMDAADTIFSLAEELPGASAPLCGEGRARLQAGAIARGSIREICFLRRVTRLGAVLSIDTPVRAGERLDLALLTGDQLSGVVEWVAGSEVGLRFDRPADVFALISRNLVQQPGDARRMPRIELQVTALLETEGRREFVTVRNLSDGGARLDTRSPLAVRQQVVLTLDGFRAVPASVRWTKDGSAGIAFEPELSWQELMPWLRRSQNAYPVAEEEPEMWAGPLTPRPESKLAKPQRQEIGLNLAARAREGSRRWNIEVQQIDAHRVRFVSFSPVEAGRLFWISLPGLAGWPARVAEQDGDLVTCDFTQPLHPAVLERIRAMGGRKRSLL
jgi:hypothetical protein